MPHIYLGRSANGIDWVIDPEKIPFVDENGRPFMPLYAYDPRLVRVEDVYYIIWCTDFYGAAIGMKEIGGIIVPILTPMNEDESVNLDALRVQIDRMIDAGVHGIFCFGTNGEGYILTDEEKEAVLEATVEQVNGRVPVYAGTGCVSTAATIRMSQRAKAIGADALSVITPWFAAASQTDLYEHYRAVAQAVDLPMILYNIPARTGNALAPATVEKLAQMDTIVGVKDSSGNFDNMLQYIEKTRDVPGFRVLSGNDSLILWNLLAGGSGAVAGCANVFPHNMCFI